MQNPSWHADFYLFGHSSGGCAVLAALLRLGSRVKAAYIYEPVTVSPNILRLVQTCHEAQLALIHILSSQYSPAYAKPLGTVIPSNVCLFARLGLHVVGKFLLDMQNGCLGIVQVMILLQSHLQTVLSEFFCTSILHLWQHWSFTRTKWLIFKWHTALNALSRESGLMAQTTRRLCKSALKRKYYFTSKEAAFEQYSQRGFKTFNKDMVWAYVNHGFRSTAGDVQSCMPEPDLFCSTNEHD